VSDDLLRVEGIDAGYGDLKVLRGVDVSVSSGGLTALLGRNGAGKTTTVSAIAGLVRVGAGRVTWAGEDITTWPTHRRVRAGIGVVQEGKRIFRRRTVEENLLIGGLSARLGRRGLSPRLTELYGMFPVLGARRRERAGGLSGGQQQMLAIAQALVPGPRLLVLDEPSAGLSPAIVKEVLGTVRQLLATGLGVLLVEQAVEEAVALADRVTVLDLGRVVLDSPRQSLDGIAAIREAYLGAKGPERTADTERATAGTPGPG
jgi:branched-chain amino acid transport system ATP-binding protein